jgi:hypothetical protein
MSTEKPTHEYRLDLGGTVIAFHCFPPPFGEFLGRWFDRPSCPENAHIDLELELIPHEESLRLPNTLLKSKTLTGDGGFDIDDGLFRGFYNPGQRRGRIEAKAILARGQLMRVMEQIFYQAFFSARQVSGRDSIMIHSSAVIAGGQGFLFVGPSEAGKSTVARLSGNHHVLGDEMNLVHFTDGSPVLEGTAFNGTFRDKKSGSAPLRAVFLLNQAPHHAVSPIGSAHAGSLLAAEVVPPVGLDQIPDSGTVPAMVDAAARLIAAVPVSRLDFLPDAGFWSVIAEHHGLALT